MHTVRTEHLRWVSMTFHDPFCLFSMTFSFQEDLVRHVEVLVLMQSMQPSHHIITLSLSLSLSLSVSTAILQVNLGQPVFIEARDDGSGGDSWSYRSCKAPVESLSPTNQHQVFLQAGCPSCRPTNSVKALKGKYHILWTCLPQTHLGVFQLCL